MEAFEYQMHSFGMGDNEKVQSLIYLLDTYTTVTYSNSGNSSSSNEMTDGTEGRVRSSPRNAQARGLVSEGRTWCSGIPRCSEPDYQGRQAGRSDTEYLI